AMVYGAEEIFADGRLKSSRLSSQSRERKRGEMETTTKKTLDESELANFTGSENWYRHWLGKVVFTDGAKHVADQAGAYWLIGEIAIQQTRPKVRAEEFQVWTLKVDLEKHKAALTCDDGNGNVVFTKK